jgi:Caspase domain
MRALLVFTAALVFNGNPCQAKRVALVIGNGFEIAGQNYLLPTDVPPASEGEEELVKDAAFAIDRIIDRIQARGARTTMVVLDACRNNPFARPGTRAVGGNGGRAPLVPPEGTFVLFSAGAKQTALDGLSENDPDPNSVLTRHFVRDLAVPGMSLVQLAKRTQSAVKQVAAGARHDQTPAYYDEIVGDVVLNERQGTVPDVQVAVSKPPASELIAPRPEPPPPAQPINAPLASFMRSNAGWSVSLSFVDPVTAISWRLGETGPFKETGFLDTLDPRTRRRLANPSFQLDVDTPATVIQVQAVDLNGRMAGPFPIAFDPGAEIERGDRHMLEMTAGSWLSFREFNGLLLYYTHLLSYRCGIREVRIGIDTTIPNQAIPLTPCDPMHPYEIPANAKPYLKVPAGTKMVSIELTYRDGSVSETKTFRR